LLLSALFSTTLWAESVTVRGKFVSASDQKGLPYATISVAREPAPAAAIKKLATQENGTSSTALDPGKYIFTFYFVGMDQLEKPVEIGASQKSVDMGEIKMTESSTELDEISVTAQAPLVKVEIDKLTYNAKDD